MHVNVCASVGLYGCAFSVSVSLRMRLPVRVYVVNEREVRTKRILRQLCHSKSPAPVRPLLCRFTMFSQSPLSGYPNELTKNVMWVPNFTLNRVI